MTQMEHQFEEHNEAFIHGIDTRNTETSDFTKVLKETLNIMDDEEMIIQKIVDAALQVEFKGMITKDGYDKMYTIIAESLLNNVEFKKEAMAIAYSILDKKSSQAKRTIH